MENLNKRNRGSNSAWGGMILLGVGLVFLLANLDINIPHWVISWHTILLVVGLVVGFKQNFKGGTWLVMVVVGAIFTIEDIVDFDFNFWRLAWPLMLIGLGAYIIMRPGKRNKGIYADGLNDEELPTDSSTGTTNPSEDFLDSVNVFGGSHQKVFSKNFKGGDILAVFGGCDVDLTQADFQETIVIDVTAIFGGCKIIMPPSWEVKSEITAIFGGVDDKRNLMPSVENAPKRVVLRGTAMFGGVDIRNY